MYSRTRKSIPSCVPNSYRFNVGVTQFGQRQSLFVAAGGLVAEGPGRQDFQRHIVLKLLIMSTIDDPHPAAAKFLEDAVVAQSLAYHGVGPAPAAILGCTVRRVNV